MEPKYILVYDTTISYGWPYIIYEQIASYILTGEQRNQLVHREPPMISQRRHQGFTNFEDAIKELSQLNGNEPILLAYSTKTIDNSFDPSRG